MSLWDWVERVFGRDWTVESAQLDDGDVLREPAPTVVCMWPGFEVFRSRRDHSEMDFSQMIQEDNTPVELFERTEHLLAVTWPAARFDPLVATHRRRLDPAVGALVDHLLRHHHALVPGGSGVCFGSPQRLDDASAEGVLQALVDGASWLLEPERALAHAREHAEVPRYAAYLCAVEGGDARRVANGARSTDAGLVIDAARELGMEGATLLLPLLGREELAQNHRVRAAQVVVEHLSLVAAGPQMSPRLLAEVLKGLHDAAVLVGAQAETRLGARVVYAARLARAPTGVEQLVAWSEADEEGLRRAAVEALASHDVDAASEALIGRLEDSTVVAAAAVAGLVRIGRPRAIMALAAACTEREAQGLEDLVEPMTSAIKALRVRHGDAAVGGMSLAMDSGGGITEAADQRGGLSEG